jgi:hypothetical protein
MPEERPGAAASEWIQRVVDLAVGAQFHATAGSINGTRFRCRDSRVGPRRRIATRWPHSDAVFGVTDSLIHEFTEHDGGTAPDGRPVGTAAERASSSTWCSRPER